MVTGAFPVGVESVVELFAPAPGTLEDREVSYAAAREKLRDLRPGDRRADGYWRDRTAARALRWLSWWGIIVKVGRGRYRLEPDQRAGGYLAGLRAVLGRLAPAFPVGRTWRYAMVVPVQTTPRARGACPVGIQFLSTVPSKRLWPVLQHPPPEVEQALSVIRHLLRTNPGPEVGAALAFQVLAEVIARQPAPCLWVGHPWELLLRTSGP